MAPTKNRGVVPDEAPRPSSSEHTNSTTLRPGKEKGTVTAVCLLKRLHAFKVWNLTPPTSVTGGTPPLYQSPSLANVNLVQIISAYVHNGPYKSMGFSAPKGSSINWVCSLPDLSNREPILDSALAALCLAHIGKTQQDEHALRMARLSYGSALKHFQAAVVRGRRDANILSAINCLCIYELYDSALSNAIGFIKHIQGGHLVASDLYPNDQTPLSEINSFHIFRTMMIYNSFAARKACSLAQYRRPVPQQSDLVFPDVLEGLEDTTIQIPKLVEQSDLLLHSPYTIESRLLCSDIISQWRTLTYQLNNWYFQLYKNYEAPFEYYKTELYASSYHSVRFGSPFTFSSYWIAQSLMHYWAGQVLLCDALAQAISWLRHENTMHPLDSFTLGPLPLLTSPSEQAYQDASIELAFSSNLTLCAALIEQSQDRAARTALKGVQYVSAEELGTLSYLRSCSPLYIAMQHFQKKGLAQELSLCWVAAKHLDKNRLAVWEMLDLSSEKWKSIAEGKGDASW
ncbi:hypothetical protein V499_00189 [Pseudogymnoascus sp. VKM F-103]|nr:hypothetical protein V499_00189 [Pseudogymnoascus sp. VKM F-103]